MEEGIITSWIIQGGALGLLAVVLILIWKYITNRTIMEDARVIREQVRLDKTLSFMQELSTNVTTQQAHYLEIWKELSQKTLNSLERVHERINHIDEKVDNISMKIDRIEGKK